jgi:CRP/FNR family transcriptional regulator, cyclic AMP receptor protein
MMAIFNKKDDDPLILIQKGDYKKAIKLLQTKLKASPRDLNLKLRLAEAYEGLGEKENAARVYLEEAQENIKERQKERAYALLKKAEKLLPDDEEIKNGLKSLDEKKDNDSFSFDVSMDAEIAPEEEAPEAGAPEEDKSAIVEVLQNLFDSPREGLDEIASACTLMKLDDGETFIREGESGDSLYLILDGTVEVFTEINGADKCIKVLSRGEIVGEASFLKKVPRTATLVSKGSVTVAELTGNDAREVLKHNPKLLESLEKILETRVADFIRQLREKK